MKQQRSSRPKRRKPPVAKNCYFCEEQKNPWFSDTEVLNRFITERGKIIGRARSGVCAKHQRRLSLGIKHARHLALIPFIVRT